MIHKIEIFEDEKGRVIRAKQEMQELIQAPLGKWVYFGSALLTLNTGQHIPFNFKIDAENIFDAYAKFDETSKIEGQKQIEAMQTEMRRQAIISGAMSANNIRRLDRKKF